MRVPFPFQIAGAILAVGIGLHWPQSLATPSPKVLLTFDMPIGGCRMSIRDDGSAALFYGALDTGILVRSGTFDTAQLIATFRGLAKPGSLKATMSQPLGTVSFLRQEPLMWFNDERLAKNLFLEGLANRVPWTAALNPKGESVILRGCSGIDLARIAA